MNKILKKTNSQITKNLNSSENIFRTVWEKSSDGLLITDSEGKIVMCNNAYADMVRMRKEELEGKSLSGSF